MYGSLVKGVLNFEIQKDAAVEFHCQVLYQTVIFETGRWGAIIWSSDSELGEIQWMGLQQPAGRDYVQSKEYSSELLNQVSKVREIPIPLN